MIKDITLGQYFPGSSVVHNLDARFKLVITLLFIYNALYRRQHHMS